MSCYINVCQVKLSNTLNTDDYHGIENKFEAYLCVLFFRAAKDLFSQPINYLVHKMGKNSETCLLAYKFSN